MLPVVFHELAQQESRDAIAYLENESPGLGLHFIRELNLAAAAIAEAPRRWPVHSHGKRRYLLKQFSYALFYDIEPTEINVTAIAHTSRKPGYWKRRR